jgi:hypothetical protein
VKKYQCKKVVKAKNIAIKRMGIKIDRKKPEDEIVKKI